MYSDLFDQLGGGAGGGGSSRRGGSSAAASPPAVPPLVSFKAGKIVLEKAAPEDTSFQCKADPTTRGEIRLVYHRTATSSSSSNNNSGSTGLHWEFYNRREGTVTESVALGTTYAGTVQRVPLSTPQHQRDRIYVWYKADGSHELFWMQQENDPDEETKLAKLNGFLQDPSTATPPEVVAAAASSSSAAAAGSASSASTGRGGRASKSASAATSSATTSHQVDALSTILENLGMPQDSSGGGAASSTTAAPAASAATGTLTLADLQGAMMATLQQQQQQQPPVPLAEVVTPSALSTLLESPEAVERLRAFLPEAQAEQLEENLRSPQVQQTFRSLTQAILPDDVGNWDGLASVLANFQLDPNQQAITQAQTSGNPMNAMQVFLDCVQSTVEREDAGEKKEEEEKSSEEKEETKDEEMKDA